MNQFNKEILDALSSDSKTSLKDVFRNQLEQTVNTLLQEELSAVLGYQPYERNDVKGGFELSFYGGLKMHDLGGLRINRC